MPIYRFQSDYNFNKPCLTASGEVLFYTTVVSSQPHNVAQLRKIFDDMLGDTGIEIHGDSYIILHKEELSQFSMLYHQFARVAGPGDVNLDRLTYMVVEDWDNVFQAIDG